MAAIPFRVEKYVAISAVVRACALTTSVFNRLVKSETVTKDDKSPVTVADYSAQAVVNTVLAHAFPNDPIVGEEDASDLRKPQGALLRERIVELANEALTGIVADKEDVNWGLGKARSTHELLDAIDRGNYAGGPKGRMWALDPIDGTKGFLRGEQYAVCLALIVDSIVQVGVIGCPNLHVDVSKPDGERGAMFVAVRGQGAQQLSLSSPYGDGIPLQAAHSAHGFNARVAAVLGISQPPNRMDSQAKYCVLSRGVEGDVYLRMPVPGKGYREKIWDHASGTLLIQEAGGIVSDSLARPLDFGRGRTLGENFGVIATSVDIHPKIIHAIKQVRDEEEKIGKL